MNKQDFDQLEEYIYIESILENLTKVVSRVEKLENENKRAAKHFKYLFILTLILSLLLVLLTIIIMG